MFSLTQIGKIIEFRYQVPCRCLASKNLNLTRLFKTVIRSYIPSQFQNEN